MAFTDDDLKRLKEYINAPNFAYTEGCPDFLKAHALLARLEAAEKCVEKAVLCPSLEWDKHHESWRKAAGK
jgi:hypothetical protein